MNPGPQQPDGRRTDDDMAKAIVSISQALESDRLTVGHAITLIADLLAAQRAEIHAQYERLAVSFEDNAKRWAETAEREVVPLSAADQDGRSIAWITAALRVRQVKNQ